jgi:hypothetical protein
VNGTPQDGRRRAQARLIRQEALNSVMGKAAVETSSSGNTDKSYVPFEYAKQIGA